MRRFAARVSIDLVARVGLSLVAIAALSAVCGSARARAQAQGVRPPTAQERARIVAAVRETWKYESEPDYLELGPRRRLRYQRPPLRPDVVRVRVSRDNPRFASAVVLLRDRRGRRSGLPAVIAFAPVGSEESPVLGPKATFANACTSRTQRGLRALVCPDPWSVLDYPRPRVRSQTKLTQPLASPNLHRIDWKKVALPGAVCGSSRPIRPRNYGYGAEAFLHPDVDLRWWNPVWVSSWTQPIFGDLDGDGLDEAALGVVCANGGGTAAGQLAFSAVVFAATREGLRVVGIVTPQQPLRADTPHVPLLGVRKITRGRVVVDETWYGPHDGSCCGSGAARTTWLYLRGRLHRGRTVVVRHTWTSPLFVQDVIARPGAHVLESDRRVRVPGKRARFNVLIESEGHATKRRVAVTFTIHARRLWIVRTKTIARITPWAQNATTLVFGGLGRLPAGNATVTIDIHDPGTNPVRYPVLFTRR